MRWTFFAVVMILILLLSSCGGNVSMTKQEQIPEPTPEDVTASPSAELVPTPATPSPSPPPNTPQPLYTFTDVCVQQAVEEYFHKTVDELTADDFATLSQFACFSVENEVKSLKDLPSLCPNLKYLNLGWYDFSGGTLSLSDCDILQHMGSLKAVTIYANGLPSLGFAKNLDYVNIMYTDDAYLSENNNLGELSVLGKDYVESQVKGHIKEYIRVVDGDRIFELVCTDYTYDDEFDVFYEAYETSVFVSAHEDNSYRLLDSLDVPGRTGNASGGLILTDVNFDGVNDILVNEGHFGSQGLIRYTCYLNRGGTYKLNESFSDISNPALDTENKKVLGCWRNWAASHSWVMYSFVNGVFVETDRLTEEPDKATYHGTPTNSDYDNWIYTAEYLVCSKRETTTYQTKDYTEDDINAMFFDDNSYWALYSEKWGTLNNLGSYKDWSIYGSSPIDAQIASIISRP